MHHIDSHTIACESLDEFRKTIKDKEIRVIFLAWREEWAPSTQTPGVTHGAVVFGGLRELTVLGYQGTTGVLVRFAAGATWTRAALKELLMADGLTVQERCRNIS